jgi:hypothetical protein
MLMQHNWKHEATMRLGASVKVTAKKGSKRLGQEYHRRIYRELKKLLQQEQGVRWLEEPWFRNLKVPMMRSPDGVILLPEANVGIVVEVKLNWKDGRDIKLIDEYLPIVKNAFQLEATWPLLITRCLRGCKTPPLLGLKRWEEAMAWLPNDPTPVMLVP